MNRVKNLKAYLKGSKLSQSVFALFMAFLVSSIVLLVCGYNPLEAFYAIYKSSFSSVKGFVNALSMGTPLIFSGLAFVVAKRVGMISLGGEGQLYVGGMAGVLVAIYAPLPGPLLITVSMLVAMIAGGIWGYFPGKLKTKFGANEVISTLMLNYVAVYFIEYLVTYVFMEEGGSLAQTVKIQDTAKLIKLYPKSELTIAFIIAVAIAFLIKFIFDKTVLGYEITAVGLNKKAAETAGISVNRTILITMIMSGAIAALAGISLVLGVKYRMVPGISTGLGFNGIAVAALAANNPLGVIISGIIFGALKNASYYLTRTTDIPTDFVNVIQAFVILFVASPRLLEWIKSSFRRKK